MGYKEAMKTPALIPTVDVIARHITVMRGQRVIVDTDLAQLYDVPTKVFNQAVKRNQERFPEDFMFQLTKEEHEILRSQIVTSSSGYGGRRYLPYVFTEHGALMAATILNSARAVEVSIYVVRGFLQLRDLLATHKELARQLAALEKRVTGHDKDFASLVAEIRRLLNPASQPKRRRIGF